MVNLIYHQKKKLASDTKIEVILVDATEIEIERPKKNKEKNILARKRNTQ